MAESSGGSAPIGPGAESFHAPAPAESTPIHPAETSSESPAESSTRTNTSSFQENDATRLDSALGPILDALAAGAGIETETQAPETQADAESVGPSVDASTIAESGTVVERQRPGDILNEQGREASRVVAEYGTGIRAFHISKEDTVIQEVTDKKGNKKNVVMERTITRVRRIGKTSEARGGTFVTWHEVETQRRENPRAALKKVDTHVSAIDISRDVMEGVERRVIFTPPTEENGDYTAQVEMGDLGPYTRDIDRVVLTPTHGVVCARPTTMNLVGIGQSAVGIGIETAEHDAQGNPIGPVGPIRDFVVVPPDPIGRDKKLEEDYQKTKNPAEAAITAPVAEMYFRDTREDEAREGRPPAEGVLIGILEYTRYKGGPRLPAAQFALSNPVRAEGSTHQFHTLWTRQYVGDGGRSSGSRVKKLDFVPPPGSTGESKFPSVHIFVRNAMEAVGNTTAALNRNFPPKTNAASK